LAVLPLCCSQAHVENFERLSFIQLPESFLAANADECAIGLHLILAPPKFPAFFPIAFRLPF
jgi:hypothetical protein